MTSEHLQKLLDKIQAKKEKEKLKRKKKHNECSKLYMRRKRKKEKEELYKEHPEKNPKIKKRAIKVSSVTGKVYIDYHKKKPGRKAKTGPKVKKYIPHPTDYSYERYDYRLVRTLNNVQKEYIGKFKTLQEANDYKNALVSKNDQIAIPKMYMEKRGESNFITPKSEYVILERVLSGDNASLIRNDYGKYIEHNTTSDKWRIVDKFVCQIEEKFHVFPYNCRNDRKDIHWITYNFIDKYINTKYDIVRITVYGNKVMFIYDDNLELVICKTPNDAIRVHNYIETKYKKVKQVAMMGKIQPRSSRAKDAAKMIEEKTGWSHAKVLKPNTHK